MGCIKYPRQWEAVSPFSLRLKIYGGWLVESHSESTGGAIALCYVPDTNHAWELEYGMNKCKYEEE